jgi:hypothetical protein
MPIIFLKLPGNREGRNNMKLLYLFQNSTKMWQKERILEL